MSTEIAVPRTPTDPVRLSAEDFETASVRSAAPSYVSDVPSYHSTIPNGESVPPYSPPAPAPLISSSTNGHARVNSAPSPSPAPSPRGLPPVPTGPLRRPSDVPTLYDFRIPSWSTITRNPTARHYHNVANRRVMATNNTADALDDFRKKVGVGSGRLDLGERSRPRPLEDPALVGEVAAARARAERMVRENPDEILAHEDKRWDWFLAQSKDWDERERNWTQFRRRVERNPGARVSRRIGVL